MMLFHREGVLGTDVADTELRLLLQRCFDAWAVFEARVARNEYDGHYEFRWSGERDGRRSCMAVGLGDLQGRLHAREEQVRLARQLLSEALV